MEKEKICKNCQYWQKSECDSVKITQPSKEDKSKNETINLVVNYGECRRFPPVIEGYGGDTRWPSVSFDDFCGEFRAKGQNQEL